MAQAIIGNSGAQTEQAWKDVLVALAAGGAAQENVLKLNVPFVQGLPHFLVEVVAIAAA